MYINVYDEKKYEKDLWIEKQTCRECGHFSYFHLFKVKHTISILFFKIYSKTENYLIVCDNCKTPHEIDKKTYKNLKKQQIEKIKANMVDKEIVLSDFSPTETQFLKKKIKYILSLVWLAIFILGTIGMISDITEEGNLDASVPIGTIFMLTLGAIPLFFSLRTYKLAKKQKEIYVNIQTQ